MTSEQLDLAAWFADMGRDLLARGGVGDTLNEICQLAVAAIDACQAAGVSQVHRGQRIETPAATTKVAEDLHTLQYELNDGPCMDAAWEQQTIGIDDMTDEGRWPRFAAEAAKAGIRSTLCFQLFWPNATASPPTTRSECSRRPLSITTSASVTWPISSSPVRTPAADRPTPDRRVLDGTKGRIDEQPGSPETAAPEPAGSSPPGMVAARAPTRTASTTSRNR